LRDGGFNVAIIEPSLKCSRAAQGCRGVRAANSNECMIHASDDERRLVLESFQSTGELDLRGIEISDVLFNDIRRYGPDPHETPWRLQCESAKFSATTDFDNMHFR